MLLSQADLVSLVAAAVGAFLGAASAFLLEWMRRRSEARDIREGALLNAQFSLAMQLNTLAQLQKQYLDPKRDSAQRHLQLVPAHMRLHEPVVDMSSIVFIASLDAVETLQAVHIAQDAYVNAVGIIDERSRMYEQVCYDPAVESREFDYESGVSSSVLDARQVRVLESLTNGMYSTVDAAVELEHAAITSLRDVIKRVNRKAVALAVSTEVPGASG